MINHYEILEVSENANISEIKVAYKRLAKKFHPDLNPEKATAEDFKLLTVAYSILSNPVERSKYDSLLAQLRLARSQSYFKENRPFPPTYQNRGYYRQPFGPRFKTNKRADRLGTVYAVGIIAAISIIVYLVTFSWEYYQDYQKELLTETFDARLKLAESFYLKGKQKDALLHIDTLRRIKDNNPAINSYAFNFISSEREKAEIAKEEKHYKLAIWHMLVYMQFTRIQKPEMLYNLALSYRAVQEYEKAVFILNKLLGSNYRPMFTISLIAEIYYKNLDNKEIALTYFEMALKNIIEEFKSTYGNAYRLLVTAEKTPLIYKKIYRDTAEVYYDLGNYMEARKLLEWVVFFEPSKAQGYELLIQANLKLNDIKSACSVLKKARSNNVILEIAKINCDV